MTTATFPQGYSPWQSEPTKTKLGSQFHTLVGFDGKFRHYCDRGNFPFDEHVLDIVVASSKNEKSFRMTPDPDTKQTTFNPEIKTPRWDIEDFWLTTNTRNYNTDFGDKSDSTGKSSNFSNAVLHIKVTSSDTKIFWELAGPIFIVFLITLLTFLLTSIETSTFAGRITALGASLFAVLVSMSKLSDLMPATAGWSMLGKLHLLTLLYVLVGITITVISWRWANQEKKTSAIRRLNHVGIAIGVIVYVGGSIWLVTQAAAAAPT